MSGFNQWLIKACLTLFVCAVSLSATSASYKDDEPPAKDQPSPQEEETPEADIDAEKPAEDSEKEADEKKSKDKTLAKFVEDYIPLEGLFKLYRDPKLGALYMEVRADQLEREYIYVSHVVNGVPEGGHFRGQYRSEKILSIKKYFNKIEFTQKNPHFYFDPDNNLAKAQTANISEAKLSVHGILAKSEEEDAYLIKVDSLFTTEALTQIKPSNNPKLKPHERFNLGKLSAGKTRISDVRTYPKNLAVDVEYVYSNAAPQHYGSWFDITDARNVSVTVQHTLLEVPANDYTPRLDDPRVGYFIDYINDMTSHNAAPWRDVIARWHLVKKDPKAAISEPIEPIVWWIENTTPEELRPIIKKAGESWNIAFEQAGFKNALIVRTQPDNAEWDAGDIRYNVLRWTSSPRPPFGGYGPSFTNPRTGQILAADIMLEYTFLTNRLTASAIFDKALLEDTEEDDNQDLASFTKRMENHARVCSVANHLQLNNMVANTLNTVMRDSSTDVTNKVVEESIYYLILHEIGHTLGLNHNMKATQARSYSTAHDINAQENGLAGSVMDYPSVNFAPLGKKQAHYYTIRPGDYDIWAIQFGYDPKLDDPKLREAHLARSTEKALAFGNDADDMRAPGKGIDPRVNIYDMTDDAIQFAEDRLKLDHSTLKKLHQKIVKPGDSYQALRDAYVILTSDIAWQGRVISRYIGGVYVDRANVGQQGASAPYRPVEAEKQRKAMKVLRDYIFAPDAFEVTPKLLQHLAIQRRGFMHYSGTEDPKLHGRSTRIQADILNHLLHSRTLLRLTDTALYGNKYSITEMMTDLTGAIFEDDARGAVNSFRQQLQIMYVKGLIGILKGDTHDYVARSNTFSNLNMIRKNMARWRGDAATRAHRDHVTFLIDKALEVYKG